MNKSVEPFRYRHRTFFVGLFIATAAFIIITLLFFSLIKTTFEKKITVHIRLPRGMGISAGTEVHFKDIEIGSVKSVNLNSVGNIDVTLRFDAKYSRFIKKDCIARLKQKNPIMGGWIIELSGGSDTAATLCNSDTIRSESSPPLDEILGHITTLLTSVNMIIETINSGRGSLGKALKEDTLIRGVYATINNTNRLLTQLQTTADKTNNEFFAIASKIELSANKMIDSITVVLGNINNLLKTVNHTVITLDSTLVLATPSIVESVQRDLLHVERLLQSLNNNWIFKRAIAKQPDPLLTE